MRAISIRQPWAYAITHLGKRIENRSWKSAPSYRGPLLIHAAKGCTTEEEVDAAMFMLDAGLIRSLKDLPRAADLPRGAYVAVADLAGAHRHAEGSEECGDPWAIAGQLHLVLANVRALQRPIPAAGMLGLFRPEPEHVRELELQTGQPLRYVGRP